MAILVVHVSEVVDIEHDEGESALMTDRAIRLVLEPGNGRSAIGKAGQDIGAREILKLALPFPTSIQNKPRVAATAMMICPMANKAMGALPQRQRTLNPPIIVQMIT